MLLDSPLQRCAYRYMEGIFHKFKGIIFNPPLLGLHKRFHISKVVKNAALFINKNAGGHEVVQYMIVIMKYLPVHRNGFAGAGLNYREAVCAGSQVSC